MTLIELLVVASIIMMMVAITVPRLKPAMEGRRIREAARAIHLYLASARAIAMSSGRACGVMIERLPAESRCSMNLSQVEVPPSYAGDETNSVATVAVSGNFLQVNMGPGFTSNLVQMGDQIQLNGQGPWYFIRAVSGSALTLEMDVRTGQLVPWTTTPSLPVPYKIVRRPVKSGATPLQLPVGAVIDLVGSGQDYDPAATSGANLNTLNWETGVQPIIIMFSPNGTLDRGYYEGNASYVTSPLYLLIGRRDKVGQVAMPGATRNDLEANLDDAGSIWIALNPNTGLTTTTELRVPDKAASVSLPEYLYYSRQFARTSDMMGGR